ncbi:MAG: 16S rRNA (guanine(966)-N(2))-methyltransferase RsmD [Clostridia bacterium]|nr:16S rRNA (guanine(966)-N(2))-methyltransferase RsmD [Clostridia bacterium]MDD4276154.1 16S rRNA (guanine(966)-N(2))-methyltransferase RsmD [Clostridia bacterium]
MRIIAGKYKGRVLKSLERIEVRPTLDRIKQPLFSIIQFYIPHSIVLDLFSGSGALGLEALSRGADEAVFVDKNKDCCLVTENNVKMIGENSTVLCKDYASALMNFKAKNKKFDIIFLDPPYALNLGQPVIEKIAEYKLLNEDGIIVYEHLYDKNFKLKLPKRLEVYDSRKYGIVGIEFVRFILDNKI